MIAISNYYSQIIVRSKDKDLVKVQQNYLIKMYGMTMEDINVLDKMADRIRKRWIKLQQKPKLLNRVDQFKKRCIENEIQAYQLNFERISKRIREFNESVSHKIIQCNTQLEYDEIDSDSNYKNSENESPTELNNEENSNGNLSDDGSEKKRAMLPIPYLCCNEIH